MTSLGIFIGFVIAVVLFLVAGYFAWRQQRTLHMLRFAGEYSTEHRRYLFKQCWRRLLGSFLLVIVAGMLIGALFLDYEPPPNEEAAKEALRFLFAYVATLLLFVMAVLLVAFIDFWATARFAMDQRKRLTEEHKAILKADLAQHLRRRAELN